MTSMWIIRLVILALGAALSFALIARGNIVIGVLVGAMVVARGVLLVTMMRRRREIRQRFRQRAGNRF
jgi:hypothetical protein